MAMGEEDSSFATAVEEDEESSMANASKASGKTTKSTLTTTSKKRKSPPVSVARGRAVSLLDDETQRSIGDLSKTKMENAEWDNKAKQLKHKMDKLDRLAEIREKCPLMTDDQIARLFPELKDMLDIDTDR